MSKLNRIAEVVAWGFFWLILSCGVLALGAALMIMWGLT